MKLISKATELAATTVFKNFTALAASEVFIRLCKFIVLVLAARELGPADFGLFNYVLAVAALVAVVGDFGINRVLTRNLAKDFEKANYYAKSFVIQTILLFSYIGIGLVILSFQQQRHLLVLFSLLAMFTANNVLGDYLWSFLRAKEKMITEAFAKALQAVIILVLGWALLSSSIPLYGLATSYLVGSIATLIWAIWRIKGLGINLAAFNFSSWANLIRQSWPIAIIAVSAFVFNEIDSIMLGVLKGYDSVGYYNVAYKLMAGLLIPIFILNQVLYPRFSKLPQAKAISLVRKNITFNFILYSILGAVIYLLSESIVTLFFGAEYIVSALVLNILALVALLTSVMYPLSSYSIAKDYLRVNLYLSLSAAVINIVLNFLLIPPYGFYGAAWATVLTYAFLLIGYSISLLAINGRKQISTI